MRLPRVQFRVRTLMTTVFVVALACWALFRERALIQGLTFLTLILVLFLIIPLVGASYAGSRYRPGKLDPITGGVIGGWIQAALILMSMVAREVQLNDPHFNASPGALWLGIAGMILIAANSVLGVIAGVIVASCMVLMPNPRNDQTAD